MKMKKITRYTFLNLDIRPDRKLLAACNAWKSGIPDDLVHFWASKSFETAAELAEYARRENGFQIFEEMEKSNKNPNEGHIGQVYNILCYLKDRITRKDTLEVYLHDDVYFIDDFHSKLNHLCHKIEKHRKINMILLNPFYRFSSGIAERERPIFNPDGNQTNDNDFVYEGRRGLCDFALVLSTEAAKHLYDLVYNNLRTIERALGVDMNWDMDGIFTTIRPYAKRYPDKLVGRDNNWKLGDDYRGMRDGIENF